MSERRHTLRSTFDSAAELYDAARPEYPRRLFTDLISLASLERGDRLLEIGCGTGKASRPLLEARFAVVCVELGEALARRARRNLTGLPFEVHVAPFEEWEGERGAFELVFAATGWHWLDPAVRYRKAHELLRPGGHLAFWSALHAFPPGFDPFFAEIQEVYDAIGERWEGDWPPPTPDQVPDDREEIERSGLFEDVQVRRYVWDRLYTADEYVALLETFSGHIAMEATKREHLYDEIRRRIAERDDPRVRRHWYAILHVARRASSPAPAERAHQQGLSLAVARVDSSEVCGLRDDSSTDRVIARYACDAVRLGGSRAGEIPARAVRLPLRQARTSRRWPNWQQRPELPSSARCPTRRRPSRSTSSSRRSGPSSPGSVITFDPEQLESRIAELEQELGAPGFWDDQRHAAEVSAEHARLTRRLERYRRLTQEYEDARELLAMDGDMEDEIASSIAPLRQELDRLQEDALFSGEYDAGDALVTIHAGTGGTDAQDWAEILLRMYLRWAQDRGFQTELLEASPGEEAGLKSATFSVKGENGYGILKAERGVHRLVRLSPFDQAHRRHTSFAQVIVAPLLPDDVDVELDESDLRIDTYRASGAGGQHVNKTDSAVRITHIPTGIVVQIQNERSQSSNKQTALRVLKSRLLEQEQEKREEELARERGATQQADFGSQIRSYVLHPYQLVKDHRTEHETGNTQAVLDGALDEFVHEYLLAKAAGRVI